MLVSNFGPHFQNQTYSPWRPSFWSCCTSMSNVPRTSMPIKGPFIPGIRNDFIVHFLSTNVESDDGTFLDRHFTCHPCPHGVLCTLQNRIKLLSPLRGLISELLIGWQRSLLPCLTVILRGRTVWLATGGLSPHEPWNRHPASAWFSALSRNDVVTQIITAEGLVGGKINSNGSAVLVHLSVRIAVVLICVSYTNLSYGAWCSTNLCICVWLFGVHNPLFTCDSHIYGALTNKIWISVSWEMCICVFRIAPVS